MMTAICCTTLASTVLESPPDFNQSTLKQILNFIYLKPQRSSLLNAVFTPAEVIVRRDSVHQGTVFACLIVHYHQFSLSLELSFTFLVAVFFQFLFCRSQFFPIKLLVTTTTATASTSLFVSIWLIRL